MQNIHITTSEMWEDSGLLFAKAYYATTDNPRSSTYTDGRTQGRYFVKWVGVGSTPSNIYPVSPDIPFRGQLTSEPSVVPGVLGYLGVSPEDNITLNGELIHESSLTTAQRAAAEVARQQAVVDAERRRMEAEAAQLKAQTTMLQSKTATWVSGAAYTAQVAETTAEIRAFNADVAAFLATAPAGAVQQAQQAGVSIQSKPVAAQQASAPGTASEKKGNTGIIIIGVVITVVAAVVLSRR